MTEQLYSLFVFGWKGAEDPVILSQAQDMSSFPYLQRSGVRQFMTFFSRTIAAKTKPNTRQQVVEEEYMVYCHSRDDGLAAVCICNKLYPDRVAFGLLAQTLAEFADANAGKYNDASSLRDGCLQDAATEERMKKFQNPAEADKVLKIQRELEEIQTLMMQNMDKVLERGEKVSDLVEQTSDLSATSKAFYKTAKSTNSGCCNMM